MADWLAPVLLPWLGAFFFTEAVETPIYARALKEGALPRRIAIAAGASALTHPLVWFAMPELVYGPSPIVPPDILVEHRYELMVVVAESFAIGTEALYLRAFGVRRAFLWALGANLCSVTFGLLSRAIFGWP